MYILSKSSGQPHPDPGPADDSGVNPSSTSTKPDNSSTHTLPAPSRHSGQPDTPRSRPQTRTTPGSTSSATAAPWQAGRGSLPFSFPPMFFGVGNTSSTSLAPSTAEGKPIPIDGTTAAHRTSALRQLNDSNPPPVWRPSYSKATSTKSATYSQPVIVRTYSGGPSPHNPGSSTRSHTSHHGPLGPSHRNPPRFLTSAHSTTAVSTKSAPLPRPITITTSSPNAKPTMSPKPRPKPKAYWPWQYLDTHAHADPKLPPMEAFSFKGFLADLQDSELSSNIDGIAEICARSKYSLSNQYEVHMTPHGSGEGFLASARPPRKRRRRREQGPTLQAVQSDDDDRGGYRRRIRGPGRRRSMAYGTLETIMSSSRSSEEDKSKKKSAAELAEEVRARAAKGGEGSGSGETQEGTGESNGVDGAVVGETGRPRRRKSTAFAHAVIVSTKHDTAADASSPRNSASKLVSEPALPLASSSHLEIRTTPVGPLELSDSGESSPTSPAGSAKVAFDEAEASRVESTKVAEEIPTSTAASLSSWVPWRYGDPGTKSTKARSHAERNLIGLLGSSEGKHAKVQHTG